MDQQLRIGIIGGGQVTQIVHLPSLRHLAAKFGVTALCDVSAEVVHGVADEWRIPHRYLDEQELLSRGDVDAVLVANPDQYHAATVLTAIAAGKARACREAHVHVAQGGGRHRDGSNRRRRVAVQVGYMRRYAPAFVAACERVLGPGADSVRAGS